MLGYAASNHVGTNSGIGAACGPLANSFRDIQLLTAVVRAAEPWLTDPATLPFVFETPILDRKPVVGILSHSDIIPHPPIQRAISEARAKLSAAGFKVVDFVPPSLNEISDISTELFTLDGLSYCRAILEKAGEPPVEGIDLMRFWSKKRKTMEEAWALNARRGALQKEMLDIWQKAGVDVVLMPSAPHTAVPLNQMTVMAYTVVWNAFDVSVAPGGTCKFLGGFVRRGVDENSALPSLFLTQQLIQP
jgi:amidase